MLLPVAAFSGWWLAKRDLHRRGTRKGATLSSDYFNGLNYLLNEQPDKAIDVFIKMLEVNNDTVETYLALGNLFRRRGEADRAIRIHQNLIARPTLTKDQRMQALFELGKDYMRAGFLGRAESLFLELVDDRVHRSSALSHLLDIYQQERDWEKAIVTARKVESVTNKRMGDVIAQYHCELAELAIKNGELKEALRLLKRALNYDKKCVRANLRIGDLEKKNGNYKSAIRAYKQIENQDETYLSEALEPMVECHQAIGKIDEMAQYLNHVIKDLNGTSHVVALSEVTRIQKNEQAAVDQIMQVLRKNPSIKGLNQLIKLNLAKAEGDVKEQLQLINQITSQMIENNPIYQCNNCGFKGRTLHWLCPTCRKWSTMKPIQFVDNDSSRNPPQRKAG